MLYVALFLRDIMKGPSEGSFDCRGPRCKAIVPAAGISTAETGTVAWLIENHLVMSSVAQSRDLSDRRTIENLPQSFSRPSD